MKWQALTDNVRTAVVTTATTLDQLTVEDWKW